MTSDQRTPRQLPGFTVIDRSGTPRLADPSGRAVARLNESALAIWDLCDGQTTVDEMIDAVVELTGGSTESVREGVQRTLREFARLGAADGME